MTRDGLTEENLRDGSVKDISHRSRGRPENKEEFVPERERKKAGNEDSKSGKGKRLQMEKIRKSSVRQEAVEDTVEVTPEEKVSGYRKKLHRHEKIPDDDNNLNSQKKSIRKKQLQKQMTKEQAKAGRLSFDDEGNQMVKGAGMKPGGTAGKYIATQAVISGMIYADNIDSISYYREHPLVLEAIQELRERFPDFKYFMTAQEKQDIYPEHMTAEAIAYALVDLAEDFDTYEFRDNVDDKETLVKEIEYDLYAGRGKKEYAGFLKDVMDESDELNTKAQVLLQRINDYSIPEKKDLEPMVKIVFSEYREMETGKYLPFKEANEKLGALDQTFLKENQASDKWDDLYSVGYMVLCSIDSEIHKVTGKIMLGTGEGDIIEHMKGIEDQRDVQEHILPYLYEYCGLVEKSPDIATEVNEKESAANHKEVQSEAVTVKSSDRSAGEKKKSIHDRLKENKEKLGQKSGKDNPQKGVELT